MTPEPKIQQKEDEFFREGMMSTCSLHLDLILRECCLGLTSGLKPSVGVFSDTSVL